MSPTDLPSTGRGAAPDAGPRPAGCPIREERLENRGRFVIPPSAGVIPAQQLFFAFLWAFVWTFAIAVFIAVPNHHGTLFTVLVLVGAAAGEYLALVVFFSALAARLAVEQITFGPEGIELQTRLGPLRRTRRVALPLAREFRVDAYPSPRRGQRGFGARLYLLRGAAPSPGAPAAPPSFRPLPLAEGARDEDKPWLASRLNEVLRARRAELD